MWIWYHNVIICSFFYFITFADFIIFHNAFALNLYSNFCWSYTDQVLNVKKISTAIRLTECCIILHNFLETNNDNWDELDNLDDDDDNDNDNNESNDLSNLSENTLKRAGEIKRNQIINQSIQ